ncbi:hypothetical protein [Brucella sp. 10RB9213]|uniref:hypothetical protein n=1 Tax=Brucella sp. 10RB9213 TaxID=1844039 RepID=UPI0012AE5C70|nr:hypothetical protein [Brucella sp. 10RB9213]MRN67867.1 hypothetical protein [Brucella sp. 10RB9213]
MKDFGQFTQHTEIVELPPQQIGVDEDGEPIFGKPQMQPVLVFRDASGIDWFDLAREFHHPFYIAVDEDGRVYSMEADFQSSQIAGHLIGIDSDYGYTRGPGGTVYGKLWNGTAIVEPEPEPEPIPDEISRRQFFQHLAAMAIITKAEALAAMQGGVIPAPLQAIIDQLPTEDDRFEAQMFVVGAQNFNRLHWLTDKVWQAMAWTLEQRDEFWREAAKL